jgi:polysaccharide deacetylase family protein (PEP-CTERM system associated)
VNAFTVDVEDYFHASAFRVSAPPEAWDDFEPRVLANTRHIMAMLEAHHTVGTFFVLGWVAERFPELVRELAGRGHEVACHGHMHRSITEMTQAEFASEIGDAKRAIEAAVDESVLGFRAPNYSIPDVAHWAFDELRNGGFRYDSSVFPTRWRRTGLPGAPTRPFAHPSGLHEFPMTTVPLLGTRWPVAAGTYLRLAPYGVTERVLRRLNRAGTPFIVMVHPWEIDPDQPRVSGSAFVRFKHYANLRKMAERIERLLQHFTFAPLRECLPSGRPQPVMASAATLLRAGSAQAP